MQETPHHAPSTAEDQIHGADAEAAVDTHCCIVRVLRVADLAAALAAVAKLQNNYKQYLR